MLVGYFDHNATSPLRPEVAEVIARVERDTPGNPASAHGAGRAAKAVLEDSRERIAAVLGVRPREIVFTSGGTEANNMAVFGAGRAGPVVASAVEHPAVLAAVERIPVDAAGRVAPDAFRAALRDDTTLAAVMLANNETGTIQPVAELAGIAHERGVPLHTDAVQALGKIPVDAGALGVDLLAAGAHKIGGPRGVGLLWIRPGTRVRPVLAGGGQEAGLRPGTVPVALVAGFARAVEIAEAARPETAPRLTAMRERLFAKIADQVGDVRRVSPRDGCLPNTLSVSIRGVSGEAALIALDRAGYAVATGSACASGSALPSHVLTAMGLSAREVTSSIRLSLGPGTTNEECDGLVAALAQASARLRRVSGS